MVSIVPGGEIGGGFKRGVQKLRYRKMAGLWRGEGKKKVLGKGESYRKGKKHFLIIQSPLKWAGKPGDWERENPSEKEKSFAALGF